MQAQQSQTSRTLRLILSRRYGTPVWAFRMKITAALCSVKDFNS
jgi:hypothetical protein